jgi:hypothetical protein
MKRQMNETTMKNTLLSLLGSILVTKPLAATAQWYYNDSSPPGSYLIVAGWGTGNAFVVTIPSSDNGIPVIGISPGAFDYSPAGIGSVTVPSSITGIGAGAFTSWESLMAIVVVSDNPAYSSLDGVLFNKDRSALLELPAARSGSYSVPRSVTSIGYGAFGLCSSLTMVIIPGSVTNIGDWAFEGCDSLQSVFFKGNPPNVSSNVFYGDDNATVYYLPGTTGWGATFAGRPTRLWNPLMQTSGVGPAGFGFNITGTVDIPIVIEAATNLASANWVPLQSLNLTNGAFHFSDPDWTNHPARFYRIRSP